MRDLPILSCLVALGCACGGGNRDDSAPGADGGDGGGGDLGAFVLPEALFLSDDQRLFRAADGNGDGDFHDAGESIEFADGTAITDLSINTAGLSAIDESTVLAAYWITGGTGSPTGGIVLRFEDRNLDGDALDPDEGRVWFSGALPDGGYLSRVDSLALTAEGMAHLVDDASIVRLEDLDDDGDADDAGEATVVAAFDGGDVYFEDLAILSDVPWFANCTDDALYRVADGAPVWQVDADSLIAAQPFQIEGCTDVEPGPDGSVLLAGLDRPDETTIDNALIRVKDADHDGSIDPASEAEIAYTPRDFDHRLFFEHLQAVGDGSLLVLDQYHDTITLLEDRDQDGVFRDPREWTLLYDFAISTDNGNPLVSYKFTGYALRGTRSGSRGRSAVD